MKKISTLFSVFVFAAFLGSGISTQAQSFTENFDDVTLLAGNGWSMQNLSAPVGSTNWFQGDNIDAGGPFDAFNGATNAYVGVNYNSTGSTGTISNWLMTPDRTFRNGDVFTFYTRKVSPDDFADRLEVRMSTNGTSTNAGANATSVGDFTTLLLSINPTLVLGVYPVVWTQYTITISGLPAPTSGRIAFRYFVTGGGMSGTASDYIGIDAVNYTPYVCPTLTLSPASLPGENAGTAYNQSFSQTGALGVPAFFVTAGSIPVGLTLSASGSLTGVPTATGTFNFTVTVMDASGCSASAPYSITILCPVSGPTLNAFPALCSNGTPYTLTEGSPAGGFYSGTGVSGGIFDPSFLTQTITYDYTDIYGCAYSTAAPLLVNASPIVTLSPFAAVCTNDSLILLSGESPAGGTWSGVAVTGSTFDPSLGSQLVTYSYTDGNACTASASDTFPVNTAPIVTASASSNSVCINDAAIVLGGLPLNGIWTGQGIADSLFNPSVAGNGSHTAIYTFTDSTGCIASDSVAIAVDLCVGTDETHAAEMVRIYPNPTGGHFVLELGAEADVIIYNSIGKIILSQKMTAGTTAIDLAHCSAGIYLITMRMEDHSIMERIILQ